jgi:putative ABC transport system permease protein
VDGAYPLLGQTELEPSIPLAEALAGDGIVAESAALARLGVAPGEPLRLGEATVRIKAVLTREPDRVGGLFSFGPRVLMSEELLRTSGLVRPGALVRYEDRIDLPPGADPDLAAAAIKAARPDAGWRVQSSTEVQPRVARLTDRLATFLALAGLTSLVIGGLGVAMAVQTHLARRTGAIATLKCLGAVGRQIMAVYLLQTVILAALGSLLGLLAGGGLLLLLHRLAGPLLPVRLELTLDPLALLVAAGAGILTAVAFALRPLTLARDVPPAALFRSLAAPVHGWPRRGDLGLMILAGLALAGLAIGSVPRHDLAFWFVLAVAVSLVVLTGLARLLLAGLARFRPELGLPLRLALANLRASGGGAAAVIVALGAGLATLMTTALLQANLAREVDLRLPDRAPALIFIDIQPGQREPFAQALASVPQTQLLQEVPSLRARVIRIAGRPVEQVKISPDVEWTVNRDRGLTYQAAKPDDTQLVAGEWWAPDYRGPPLLSLDARLAGGYGVGVGDTLSFNILGRTVEARIANLRQEVDWSNGRLDFLFVTSPGLLEAAPHTFVAAVDVPPEGETALIEAVAEAAPNVTPIPVRAAVRDLGATLRKIGFAVDAVAGVTLLAGVLVLAAGVAAVRDRHRYQSVILKTLGATRPVLIRSFLLEYGGLGLLSAVLGCALGTLAAWLLVTQLWDMEWIFAPLPVIAVATLAVALALAVGAVGLRRLLAQPVAPALRVA